ncbi:hypothetical protein NL526_27695, partial [Klebsiella pneumoniae]|nr:hypothetical protein [Klebsiella pneumoniae]
INRMEDGNDSGAPIVEGNRIAARYPRRVTLFIRYGRGEKPTGHAFAGWDFDFLALSEYRSSTFCRRPNEWMFAHELGHYFGLLHTFSLVFGT